MPIVICYVNESSEIQDKCLGFVHCNEGRSDEAISRKIVETLKTLGLYINMCHGQVYDRAGNMAGKIKGAAARIDQGNPQALYVHCGSHPINIAVAAACSIQDSRWKT